MIDSNTLRMTYEEADRGILAFIIVHMTHTPTTLLLPFGNGWFFRTDMWQLVVAPIGWAIDKNVDGHWHRLVYRQFTPLLRVNFIDKTGQVTVAPETSTSIELLNAHADHLMVGLCEKYGLGPFINLLSR